MPTRFHSGRELRRRATLQSETVTADGGGGGALTWTTVKTVAAGVFPINGREVQITDGDQVQISVLIVIRHRDDVTEGMRAVVDGNAHNIRAVLDPESRRQWLELQCEAGVPT